VCAARKALKFVSKSDKKLTEVVGDLISMSYSIPVQYIY